MPESESVYASFLDREDAAQWIHHQSIALHLAPDSIALAFAIFDRILFSLKVKKAHIFVLAAAAVSLATKTLEGNEGRIIAGEFEFTNAVAHFCDISSYVVNFRLTMVFGS